MCIRDRYQRRVRGTNIRVDMPREEVTVETTEDGNQTVVVTTTKTYYEDGRITTHIATETTTRTRRTGVDSVTKREQNKLLSAITEARTTRDTRSLKAAIESCRRHAPDLDIKHAEDTLHELEVQYRTVTSVETRTETEHRGDAVVKKTTVTNHWSDGTTTTEVSTETERPSRTVHKSSSSEHSEHHSPRHSPSSSQRNVSSLSPMDQDILRIQAENDLAKAVSQRDVERILICIEICTQFRSNPDTWDHINAAYDVVMEISPERGAAVTNQRFEHLPFMGMKRYLKRVCNLGEEEVDKALSKYDVWKIAQSHGIEFPADKEQLDGLTRLRSRVGGKRKY
eukprot:TRINITY_DN1342_c0_g1_i1.p1 TRINITY_DN1342_c0_g1~~TRINITY_DN1342_c0_g1_i1.p1  ORF type:complete len:340 (-),score=96.15 TRINITY_DN1342_c0_g1_i1:444-1463(-)